MENDTVTNQENKTPIRDSKGHFLPKGQKPYQKKDTEDPNVVKIKVIKEKKPKVPKSIIGKLNDLKEKTASRFIESVISNSPNCILIDGKKFYSDKYVSQLNEDLEQADRNEKDAIECMGEMKDTTAKLLDTSKEMLNDLEKATSKWNIWRAVALGLLCGYVIAFATAFARVYVTELEKNNQTAQTIQTK